MKFKIIVFFLWLIVNVLTINGNKNNLDNVFALAKNIWKIYRSSSIVIIMDDINLRGNLKILYYMYRRHAIFL
jgi:hypothetical protein